MCGVMGHGFHAQAVAFIGEDLAQRRVARELVFHVADEMRQFVAGVQAFDMWPAIDVVVGVDQPVGVEHHESIQPQRGGSAGVARRSTYRYNSGPRASGKSNGAKDNHGQAS